MYNRYIPQDTAYTSVEEERDRPGETGRTAAPSPSSRFNGALEGLKSLFFPSDNGERRGLTQLLKNLDAGDVLLLLIAVLLFVEGEDIDLAIALALVFLLGLGDSSDKAGK